MAIKLVDIELSQPILPVTELKGYDELWLLVKLHGLPLGSTTLLVMSPVIHPQAILDKIVQDLTWPIISHLLDDGLLNITDSEPEAAKTASERTALPNLTSLQNLSQWLSHEETEPPCIKLRRSKATWFVTVAVCTRDGASRLSNCLDALDKLDYPNYEILIIDNASRDNAVWKLLEQRGTTRYRYFIEPRPGISWARNRAIREAQGDIIVFTDDDARPYPFWLLSLVTALQRPGVSIVTGPGYPMELENEVQIYCEKYWGYNRGFLRKDFNKWLPKVAKPDYEVAKYGGSYSMGGWREVFQKIGPFDPALGRGSLAGTASDGDWFYRLIEQGHTISYEPSAMVRLTHPKELKQVTRHDYLGGIGASAFLTKRYLTEPAHRLKILRYGFSVFFGRYLWWSFKQLPNLSGPFWRTRAATVLGVIIGPRRYFKSVKQAEQLKKQFAPSKE